ncbi:polysaccharide pyruvyl transferase family protein [Sulfurospirillum barnesii]|uniref:Polysaccharide pyruvyl transferase n=1 Tax=Sulfurospirillum barnesii (strain ATCC 700032 / DSM 10660 / SES-3) TaxID=760154 RepID=I3XYW7_SULBS|nr:polysaccharide pyruvyl transferase family protein [Sulfurospirillum barnesii]AFL69141.1 Polysaccharide pyruvyl transferase [Sulfurospirillum barnesii SES-3]
MKIGILTLPIAENYGGILQAVALYRFLSSQGHDVVLIYKQKKQVFWKRLIIALIVKIPFQDFRGLKSNYKNNKERLKRKAFHRGFIEKEISEMSKDLHTRQDLEEFAREQKLDVVIVGSDQVWRKKYIDEKYYKNYFLDFVDGSRTKKIAYAASFGKDHWEGENDHAEIAKLLQDFTAVSMREASGVLTCKEAFGYEKAVHVLDPTMLMSKDFYQEEIIKKHNVTGVGKGGLLTYVLDEAEEKKEIIEFTKNIYKFENVLHLKGFDTLHVTYSAPQWLAAFAGADFVVTDSFHGMVFSIIFEKEFVVIGNESRGLDRFISLLDALGLKERLVFNVKNFEGGELGKINYNKVNEILGMQKKKSLEFLMRALNNGRR